MVESRLRIRHATLEKSILIFWHFSIKHDPLIKNMTLVFGFGSPEASKSAFEVWDSEFCMPNEKFRERAQASLLQQPGLSPLPEFCK